MDLILIPSPGCADNLRSLGYPSGSRVPLFNDPPHNALLVNWNLFYRALISAHPTVELQFVSFHEDVSRPLSQSVAQVIKTGFNKIIPVHTPAYQPGNFQKILVTLDHVLCLNSWFFSPYHSFPLSFLGDNLIWPFAF